MDFKATRDRLITKIENLSSATFDEAALEVFRFQAAHNPVYKRYIDLLSIDPAAINDVRKIPFLPISVFKNFTLKSGVWEEETIFTSSGTGDQTVSKHFVRSLSWYHSVCKKGFEKFYGSISGYCILALLPSYLERSGSSLVEMARFFMSGSRSCLRLPVRTQRQDSKSGFFLDDHKQLASILKKCIKNEIPTILLGVSFGLIDFAKQFPMPLGKVIVMETGGMKGRKKELTRTQLHNELKQAFQLENIHSEYGMTELFSQAYAKENGIFHCSPAMKVLIREITDPLSLEKINRPGAINVIDLANIDTCSFIATDDLGRLYEDGTFEVLGRLDNSDIRGCNLMVGNE